ncbi:MAG TPA: hypothetical protein VIG90_15125 [Pedomonas sp.]|uniref:hypothetical protein n=1 Tax=Pedomonas sp. TaxID=2976421 RepID=UPI002F415902
MSASEIVVIARALEVPVFSYATAVSGGGGSGPGGGGINAAIREAMQIAQFSITVDADADTPEIRVVVQQFKTTMQNFLVPYTAYIGKTVTLPFIGQVPGNLVRGILSSLKFKVVSKDFGPGRAGANLAGTNDISIPVEINKQQLLAYSQLPGGLAYLIAHEAAHSFKQMREFNAQMFTQYQAGAGRGLSYNQQVAQFPTDAATFGLNEARTNTIARAIMQQVNMAPIGFTPSWGYAQ